MTGHCNCSGAQSCGVCRRFRPCPNGCGSDAWDVDTVDGRGVLHFVHCQHGQGRPVQGARPWMGALYGLGRWLRALLTGGGAGEP